MLEPNGHPTPVSNSSDLDQLRAQAIAALGTTTSTLYERGEIAYGSRLAESLRLQLSGGLDLKRLGFDSFSGLLFYARDQRAIDLDRPGDVGDWEAMPPGRSPRRGTTDKPPTHVRSLTKIPQIRTDVWQAVTEWDEEVNTVVDRADHALTSIRGAGPGNAPMLPRLPAERQVAMMRSLLRDTQQGEPMLAEFDRVTRASATPVRAARPVLSSVGLTQRWNSVLVRRVLSELDEWTEQQEFPSRWFAVPDEHQLTEPNHHVQPASISRFAATLEAAEAMRRAGETVSVEITIRIG